MKVTLVDVLLHKRPELMGFQLQTLDFETVGLPLSGKCFMCKSLITVYNAYPTPKGRVVCQNCNKDSFDTVEEVTAWEAELTRLL